MALLSDATTLTFVSSLGVYGIYKRYEPAGVLSALVLLFAVPGYIASQARSQFSYAIVAYLTTFVSFYALLIAYTIGYRLSPFHPLAKYPGPVACKVSKFWIAYVASRGKTHKYICDLHNQYGDVVRTGPNELSFRHEDTIMAVFANKEVKKGPYYDCRYQKGVTPLDGIKDFHEHAGRRKLWNRAFSMAAAKEHVDDLQTAVSELLQELEKRQGDVVDISQWISFIAFDFMGSLVFGNPFGMVKAGKDTAGLAEIIDTLAYVSNVMSHIPWVWPFLTQIPGGDAPLEVARTACKNLVAKRVKSTNTNKRDLYHYLLDEDGLEPVKPSEKQALMEGATAISAGSDTTATMMVHTLFFLMQNPDMSKRLQSELDNVYSAGGEAPDYTKHVELPYLNACINETMRLYPAALAALQRRVDVGSGGKMLGPFFVPEGTQVSAHLYTMHRDPRYFYPLPDTYWPDRWLTQESYILPSGESISSSDLIVNKTVYQPFSYGQQNCAGKVVANMEMRAVLSALLHKFDIKPARGFKLQEYEDSICDVYITYRGALPVTLHARR
ncbi:unnamed protein product [Somion occarium]|uniref:Cytochrome P450 n=1 Tax=Somion occarium TaxID=3059160 RepID=A0ABP1DSG7_9APHY